ERFSRSPGDVRAACEQALQSLDRATIGTLHSFAARALRRHPLEAGVDPAFTVDEGERFESLFEERWALWLDTGLGAHAPGRGAWLEVLGDARLEDLEALARVLAEAKVAPDLLHAGPRQRQALSRLRQDVLAVAADKPPRKVKIADQIEAIARALE